MPTSQPPAFTGDLVELVDTLTRLARWACPASMAHQREDIVQRVLLRLVVRHREQPLTINRAYLRKAVYYAVCDELRRRARKPCTGRSVGQFTAATPTPESQSLNGEVFKAVKQSLDALPDARRQAVARYLEGRAISEIAAEFGWSRKRADNLVYRGLKTMRAQLSALGFCPGATEAVA